MSEQSKSAAYVEALEATTQRLQMMLDKTQAELTALKGETNKPRAWGATPVPPAKGDVWHHQSSGRLYTVECLANAMSTDHAKFPPMVIYVGPDGLLWARPLSNWHRSFGDAPVGNKPVGHAEKRETFVIPDGHEAVLDTYLKATGGVTPTLGANVPPALTVARIKGLYAEGYRGRNERLLRSYQVGTPEATIYDMGWVTRDLELAYDKYKEHLATRVTKAIKES